MIRKFLLLSGPAMAGALLVVLSLVACTEEGSPTFPSSVASPAAAAAATSTALLVHKNPQCGCCGLWVEHMQQAGFEVEVRESNDLTQLKQTLGVPSTMDSCHTAEIGGYFIEGHVPAADVQRLLTEKPGARGLAVPGMPIGSPGMPAPAGHGQAYEVLLIAEDGSTSVYARHDD